MLNEHGVDVLYFKKELKALRESLNNRTPDELCRYLLRLADVARPADFNAGGIGQYEAIIESLKPQYLALDKARHSYIVHGIQEEIKKLNDALIALAQKPKEDIKCKKTDCEYYDEAMSWGCSKAENYHRDVELCHKRKSTVPLKGKVKDV